MSVSTTPASGARDEVVRAAADRLIAAATEAIPCRPVREFIGPDDVTAAYAVQNVLHARALASGRRVAGRKVGFTSRTVQAQLGVDQPDFGFLYADMDASTAATSGAGIEASRLLQPKIEAEVAFVLGAALHTPDAAGAFAPATIAAAVAVVLPALEIVDSRIAGWDISFGDTVADNASTGLYVLGEPRRAPAAFGPDLVAGLAELPMTMTRSHRSGTTQQVSAGRGADCLGSPATALAWLAETALGHGEPLQAGQLVLAGALGPMVPVAPGDEFHAEIPDLGTVSARFAPATPTAASKE